MHTSTLLAFVLSAMALPAFSSPVPVFTESTMQGYHKHLHDHAPGPNAAQAMFRPSHETVHHARVVPGKTQRPSKSDAHAAWAFYRQSLHHDGGDNYGRPTGSQGGAQGEHTQSGNHQKEQHGGKSSGQAEHTGSSNGANGATPRELIDMIVRADAEGQSEAQPLVAQEPALQPEQPHQYAHKTGVAGGRPKVPRPHRGHAHYLGEHTYGGVQHSRHSAREDDELIARELLLSGLRRTGTGKISVVNKFPTWLAGGNLNLKARPVSKIPVNRPLPGARRGKSFGTARG
ncbi:uncharacterized protein C8Q71DRAFT_489778 [Rhodofomes roseus]|uniref:Uncharacterized protein n=1 Tax=Rhodofomes roseus TaxID=34475 RepID=A0ABQ8KLT3_9APHY|nr:uncharacterized protein C8Q71DRAFT_489778 [Rhodofomes roseus]KAH9839008.1 hypothetical protein C8Q71DRAFT_489778 [Rhodofomes roseus]